MIHYVIMTILAVLFGQFVGHANKKLPPVVSEEITYREFYSTFFQDFKIDYLYTIIFLILFNSMVYYIGPCYDIYLYTFVSVALAVTFSIDFRYQLIPDEVHLLLFCVGVIDVVLKFTLKGLMNAILGALTGGGIFFFISLLSILIFKKEGMGFGDVKLMTALGFVFGLKRILVITLIAFVVGAIVGGAILIIKRNDSDGYIPFGPFIVIGVLVIFFVKANTVIDIYLNFCSWLGIKMMDFVYLFVK